MGEEQNRPSEEANPPDGMIPSINLTIVEGGPEGGRKGMILRNYYKEFPGAELDVFLEQMKEKNPNNTGRINVTKIPYQEFLRITQSLKDNPAS